MAFWKQAVIRSWQLNAFVRDSKGKSRTFHSESPSLLVGATGFFERTGLTKLWKKVCKMTATIQSWVKVLSSK